MSAVRARVRTGVPQRRVGGLGARGRARRPALDARRRRAVLTGALTGAIVLVGASAAPGGWVVHTCVGDGGLSALGLRLSLLRPSADCPDGLALTPFAHGSAVVLLSVAVPLVILGLVLALGGLGLGTLVLRAARSAARVLATVLPLVPQPASTTPVLHRTRPPAPRRRGPRLAARVSLVHPHRGPPVLPV